MTNIILRNFFFKFQKPNFLFLLITLLYFLNNSIFSINENFSIFFYLLFLILIISTDYKFKIYKTNFKKNNFIVLLLIILPGIFFILCRYVVGISFRGDEIVHYSNSLTNLSYWFTPQIYKHGLTSYFNQPSFLIKDLINIKIVNLLLFILLNLFIFRYKKKFFNLSLILSSLTIIFFQKSFPYEYSQGSFFIDNFTQIFSYLFFPFLFSETLGLTNFILFVIYFLILRPLIINETLNIKDIKIFILIFLFPTLHLLLFSNYQEGIAVLFVLLAIECFYKFKNFKKTAILFSIAGCFREIFFLPIIVLFLFDIIKKKSLTSNIKFYFLILTPHIFHLFHISKNKLGEEKIEFIYQFDYFFSFNVDFLDLIIIFKLFLIILPVFISYLLFKKQKDNKFIILALLNLPIILILYHRNNFSFIQIDRFFYLWVLIFYFYLFIYFSFFEYAKYVIITFCFLIVFNNYSFFKKFINYEHETMLTNNKQLYIPLKKYLLKNNGKYDLIINSNIKINKFNNNLYPNINDISFNNGKDNVFYCKCDGHTININLTRSDYKGGNLCNITLNNCENSYKYINNFYSFNIFK